MNKWVLLVIGVLFLALILITVYTTLGGFKEVIVQEQTLTRPNVLAGRSFEGNMRASKLDSLFALTRQLHDKGILKGALGAIYEEVSLEKKRKGEVKAVVGVWLDDPEATLPEGFERRQVAGNHVVQARIESHFLVTPSPAEVQEKMRVFAQTKGFKVENLLLEKYLSDRSIILEMPIK